MSNPYDIGVIVGRMQPLHNGHIHLIKETLKLANKVIVFIGHCGFNDTRHFLDVTTIENMIREHFPDNENIIIKPIYDAHEDSKWVYKLETGVSSVFLNERLKKARICFVGSKKDVIWYTKLLPSWNLLLLPPYKNISATPIRKEYFLNGNIPDSKLPEVTIKVLQKYKETQEYLSMSDRFRDFYSIY